MEFGDAGPLDQFFFVPAWEQFHVSSNVPRYNYHCRDQGKSQVTKQQIMTFIHTQIYAVYIYRCVCVITIDYTCLI